LVLPPVASFESPNHQAAGKSAEGDAVRGLRARRHVATIVVAREQIGAAAAKVIGAAAVMTIAGWAGAAGTTTAAATGVASGTTGAVGAGAAVDTVVLSEEAIVIIGAPLGF
jgi:hypothetical protein